MVLAVCGGLFNEIQTICSMYTFYTQLFEQNETIRSVCLASNPL